MIAPLPSPIDLEKRLRRQVPFTRFVGVLAVFPFWSVTILPLSITYQIGKTILNTLTGGAFRGPQWSYKDSGYLVKDEDIKKLSDRSYDIVLLGATGFTGGLAVRYMAERYGVNNGKVRWAIAGRSQSKLDNVKAQLAKELNMEQLKDLPTIIVDTNLPYTMPKLVSDTKVVATTAGPYCKYGGSVVEFCSKFGTHYVDITGEFSWVSQMAHKYQSTAKKTGARIVPFSGHDSIPWDIMVMKIQETMAKECGDDLKEIKCFDEIIAAAPGGTYATLFANLEAGKPAAVPKEEDVLKRNKQGFMSEHKVIAKLPAFPKSAKDFNFDSAAKLLNRWASPFVMAQANAAIVGWSYALRSEGSKELVYQEAMVSADFKTAVATYLGLTMSIISLLNPLSLYFAKKGVFQPGTGPTMDDMVNTNYLLVSAEGIGAKGNRVQGQLYFPKDPGCLETARMLVETGLCLALESEKLPVQEGGFLSPSVACGNTLIDRLVKTGCTFTVRALPAE